MELISLIDFQKYSISEQDLFGKCRSLTEFEKLGDLKVRGNCDIAKVLNASDRSIAALKYFKRFGQTDEFPIDALREVGNLRGLKDPNIVKLLDITTSLDEHLCLVFEYCPYNLEVYLNRHPPGDIPLPQIKCIAKQIFSGLQYLHHSFIMHRVLKPSHILIAQDKKLKICDFGQSRKFSYPLKPVAPYNFTTYYKAPELLLASSYCGPSVDIWSAGCILGELFLRKPIFKGENEKDQMQKIMDLLGSPTPDRWPDMDKCVNKRDEYTRINYSSLSSTFSMLTEDAYSLISSLIKYDQRTRLHASNCIRHNWFDVTPVGSTELDISFLESSQPSTSQISLESQVREVVM